MWALFFLLKPKAFLISLSCCWLTADGSWLSAGAPHADFACGFLGFSSTFALLDFSTLSLSYFFSSRATHHFFSVSSVVIPLLSSRPERTGFFLRAVSARRFAQRRDRGSISRRSRSMGPSALSVCSRHIAVGRVPHMPVLHVGSFLLLKPESFLFSLSCCRLTTDSCRLPCIPFPISLY